MIRIKPHMNCGLRFCQVRRETPYGTAEVFWERIGDSAYVRARIPANTRALVNLPGMEETETGSGRYAWIVRPGAADWS